MSQNLKRRSSGLVVPVTAPAEKGQACVHRGRVDRTHGVPGYKCRDCEKPVYLVTVSTAYLTVEQMREWQQAQRDGKLKEKMAELGLVMAEEKEEQSG